MTAHLNDQLLNILTPYAFNGTDREGITYLSSHWPNNFMLHHLKTTHPLETMIPGEVEFVDKHIYSLSKLTVEMKIDLIRSMICLSKLLSLYNTNTRLLQELHKVDLIELKNGLYWTAEALKKDIARSYTSPQQDRMKTLIAQL